MGGVLTLQTIQDLLRRSLMITLDVLVAGNQSRERRRNGWESGVE